MSIPQRLSSTAPNTAEQTPRRGPVPLAPEWLAHVAGGQGENEAPRGRWSPIEASESTDPDAAPRGRW